MGLNRDLNCLGFQTASIEERRMAVSMKVRFVFRQAFDAPRDERGLRARNRREVIGSPSAFAGY